MTIKYEILKKDTKITTGGRKIYRIRALIDLIDDNGDIIVRKGSLGGYIESQKNLSHEGTAWIHDNACCFGNATVADNAQLFNDCRVFDRARISHNARVYGSTCICDFAKVNGNARLFNASVYGHAHICGDARIYGTVHGDVCVAYTVAEDDEVFGARDLRHNLRDSEDD